MVCPKCGFSGPDGLECQRCGVIVDKFARRGSSGTQGPAAATALLNRLPQSRSKEAPRKPIGHTLMWGLLLICVALGLGVLLDYMRLHLQGNKLEKALRGALDPRSYSGALMTAEGVLTRVLSSAREADVELPADRIYTRLRGEAGETGQILTLTVKAHLPTKLAGVFKFPIYRSVEQRFPARALSNGFSQFETDPKSAVALDIATISRPGTK